MLDIELIKSTAKEKKIALSEIAERIGYSEAGFHKALSNNTMNVKAIMKMSEVLQMPLESFVKGDETLRLAYVLADPKNGKHEAKLTELARIIEQDREYLIITISGLIEQVQEKDKQIEAFLKALSQKDQIISDYLSLLQMMSKTEMTIEKRKNGDRKPVVYKSEEEII